jgi:PAS domain S-box-containing protein
MGRSAKVKQDIYRAIFKTVNDAIILRDLKTRKIVDVNRKLCEMTGYTAEEIKKMRPGWFTTLRKQNGKTIADHYGAAARGEPQLFERQARKKDGTLFWIEANLKKVTIGGREYLLSVIRDVTRRRQKLEELKQNQEALKESEKTLRALFDAITEVVLLMDADRTVLALNQTLARTIGKDSRQIVGTRIDDYFDGEAMAVRRKYTDSVVRTGKPVQFESERAGRHFEHSVYPVFGDGGRVTRLAAFARDVTARKRAQQELEAKSRYLEEMNTALKVLLDRRELDRRELEQKVLLNVRKLILPVLHRLRDFRLPDDVRVYLDLLETGAKEITSPFLKGLEPYELTPRELEIVSLVREGKSAKEIAVVLNVCKETVDIYKHHIRKKLGINRAKTNLRSHLLSLAPQ